MRLFLTPLFVMTFNFVAFAKADVPELSFHKLRSSYPTAIECKFNYKSQRTGDLFAGRLRITRIGETFLVLRRNQETPNECRLNLAGFQDPSEIHGGSLELKATRNEACIPALSPEMRKRLDDSITLIVSKRELAKPANKKTAQVAAIYLEGVIDCPVTAWDAASLKTLNKDLEAGSTANSVVVQSSEPLETREDLKRLLAEEKVGD